MMRAMKLILFLVVASSALDYQHTDPQARRLVLRYNKFIGEPRSSFVYHNQRSLHESLDSDPENYNPSQSGIIFKPLETDQSQQSESIYSGQEELDKVLEETASNMNILKGKVTDNVEKIMKNITDDIMKMEEKTTQDSQKLEDTLGEEMNSFENKMRGRLPIFYNNIKKGYNSDTDQGRINNGPIFYKNPNSRFEPNFEDFPIRFVDSIDDPSLPLPQIKYDSEYLNDDLPRINPLITFENFMKSLIPEEERRRRSERAASYGAPAGRWNNYGLHGKESASEEDAYQQPESSSSWGRNNGHSSSGQDQSYFDSSQSRHYESQKETRGYISGSYNSGAFSPSRNVQYSSGYGRQRSYNIQRQSPHDETGDQNEFNSQRNRGNIGFDDRSININYSGQREYNSQDQAREFYDQTEYTDQKQANEEEFEIEGKQRPQKQKSYLGQKHTDSINYEKNKNYGNQRNLNNKGLEGQREYETQKFHFGGQRQTDNVDFDGQKQTGDIEFAGQQQTDDVNFGDQRQTDDVEFADQHETDDVHFGGQRQTDNVEFGGQLQTDNVHFGDQKQIDDVHLGQKQTDDVEFDRRPQRGSINYSDQKQRNGFEFGGQQQTDDVNFGDQRQTDDVQLGDQQQTDDVEFAGQQQTGNVQFIGQKQTDDVRFSGQKQTDDVEFGGQHQTDDVLFGGKKQTDDVEFNGRAQRGNTYYNGQKQRNDFEFGGQQQTVDVEFGGQHQTDDVHFGGQRQTDDVQFGGQHQTDDVHFGGQHQTDDVQFGGQHQTDDVHFGGQTQTDDVHFGGQKQTDDLEFAGQHQTGNVQLGGQQQTDDVHFGGQDQIDDVHFGVKKQTDEVEFNGHLQRGNINYNGQKQRNDFQIDGQQQTDGVQFGGQEHTDDVQFGEGQHAYYKNSDEDFREHKHVKSQPSFGVTPNNKGSLGNFAPYGSNKNAGSGNGNKLQSEHTNNSSYQNNRESLSIDSPKLPPYGSYSSSYQFGQNQRAGSQIPNNNQQVGSFQFNHQRTNQRSNSFMRNVNTGSPMYHEDLGQQDKLDDMSSQQKPIFEIPILINPNYSNRQQQESLGHSSTGTSYGYRSYSQGYRPHNYQPLETQRGNYGSSVSETSYNTNNYAKMPEQDKEPITEMVESTTKKVKTYKKIESLLDELEKDLFETQTQKRETDSELEMEKNSDDSISSLNQHVKSPTFFPYKSQLSPISKTSSTAVFIPPNREVESPKYIPYTAETRAGIKTGSGPLSTSPNPQPLKPTIIIECPFPPFRRNGYISSAYPGRQEELLLFDPYLPQSESVVKTGRGALLSSERQMESSTSYIPYSPPTSPPFEYISEEEEEKTSFWSNLGSKVKNSYNNAKDKTKQLMSNIQDKITSK